MTEKKSYHPEPYWSEVASRISSREKGNVVAGDDEPFYRYKRVRFLEMLKSVDFTGKKVLEVGNGPGGNLKIVYGLGVGELQGVDISDAMIALAKKNTGGKVKISKTDGKHLPFEDNSFDLVFTATVLQHNTDDKMLRNLIAEICRVSKKEVVIFEQINNPMSGDDLCFWRPVDMYKSIFEAQGYELKTTKFINIYISYLVSGTIRKVFNPSTRQEGEPLTKFSLFLQNVTLPITKLLDRVIPAKKDVAKLVFVKK